MNICQNEDCNTTIQDSHKLCGTHQRAAKKARKAKKFFSRKSKGFHDASGKVRPNMGLARLKELDRQKWIRRQEEKMVETICAFFCGLAELEVQVKKAA